MTRGRWWGVAGIAVAVAVVLRLIGSDVAHALLGGMLVVVAVLILAHLGIGQKVALPRLPFDRRDGARTEVSSLSWSLYGTEGVTPQAARALRGICRAGLSEAGIAVETPEGEARSVSLLGAPLTTFLIDPDAPPPDVRAVRAAVHVLENLEKSS
ncbi:hypothetical protein [Pseudactinotalea sp.]|uniref:hypothetical protein n=1 Tax=Pseudactinotalea sp. TaxID=1926260 RepID=UPI003B3A4130